YKLLLGLPPNVPVRIDDKILKSFEFSSPELRTFQDKVTQYLNAVVRRDALPSVERLREDYVNLATMLKTTETFARQVREEVLRVKEADRAKPPLTDAESEQRRKNSLDLLDKQSLELLDDIRKFGGQIDRKAASITEQGRQESQNDVWKKA